MSGPGLVKGVQVTQSTPIADERNAGPGLESEAEIGGVRFGITDVSSPSVSGQSDFRRLTLQAALGGVDRKLVQGSSTSGTDFLSANIREQQLPSTGFVDQFVRSLSGTGAVSVSHDMKNQTTVGKLNFSYDSNTISADFHGLNARIGLRGPAVREWSEAYLSNGANISQVTASFNNGQLTISPTVNAELPGKLHLTNSIDMKQLTEMISTGEMRYRHSLSGTREDPSTGYLIGDTKVLFNQYSFAQQPGASVLSLDLFDQDARNTGLTILLGTLPDMGSFIGGRWKYEASTFNGVVLSPNQLDGLSSNSNSRVYHIHAEGNLLFVRTPDGAARVVGELSVERTNEDRAAALKINIRKNLGMPDEVNTGFDTPVNFFFEYRW